MDASFHLEDVSVCSLVLHSHPIFVDRVFFNIEDFFATQSMFMTDHRGMIGVRESEQVISSSGVGHLS
jgi:hypothetical protein